MISTIKLLKDSVIDYCAHIGADPMLVQGAGGNVSWKDGETLWVKASGTWLADAADKDIFVPVDLDHLKRALAEGDFGVAPKVGGVSTLRPSIETMLHGLMPHPVVIHLHAVEVLAHLIRDDFEETFNTEFGDRLRWVKVPYRKPGAALAEAVSAALDLEPGVKVVFLQNHGVVIGGNDVAEVAHILQAVVTPLTSRPRSLTVQVVTISPLQVNAVLQYVPVPDVFVHQLALDTKLFDGLSSNWAFCPDHVVFLGPVPACYADTDAAVAGIKDADEEPDVIFVRGLGVLAKPGFNQAKLAQLRCYYDVMARQPNEIALNVLSDGQIAELLDWDAEKYRMKLAK